MNVKTICLILLLGCLLFLPQGSSHSQSNPPHYVFLPIIHSPPLGENVLDNPSFEAGWYHPGGIPELQIPTGWLFHWEEGHNPLAPESWNAYVRPEVRVLSAQFLPPDEQALFIWDGDQTLKVFKGYGSISYSLETAVELQPGNYLFEIHLYPDLVVDYVNGEKVFAPDPLSGEVKLDAGSESTDWQLPIFGEKNRYTLPFTVTSSTSVLVKASFRGRWAIRNNGWFMDDWGIYRLD